MVCLSAAGMRRIAKAEGLNIKGSRKVDTESDRSKQSNQTRSHKPHQNMQHNHTLIMKVTGSD